MMNLLRSGANAAWEAGVDAAANEIANRSRRSLQSERGQRYAVERERGPPLPGSQLQSKPPVRSDAEQVVGMFLTELGNGLGRPGDYTDAPPGASHPDAPPEDNNPDVVAAFKDIVGDEIGDGPAVVAPEASVGTTTEGVVSQIHEVIKNGLGAISTGDPAIDTAIHIAGRLSDMDPNRTDEYIRDVKAFPTLHQGMVAKQELVDHLFVQELMSEVFDPALLTESEEGIAYAIRSKLRQNKALGSLMNYQDMIDARRAGKTFTEYIIDFQTTKRSGIAEHVAAMQHLDELQSDLVAVRDASGNLTDITLGPQSRTYEVNPISVWEELGGEFVTPEEQAYRAKYISNGQMASRNDLLPDEAFRKFGRMSRAKQNEVLAAIPDVIDERIDQMSWMTEEMDNTLPRRYQVEGETRPLLTEPSRVRAARTIINRLRQAMNSQIAGGGLALVGFGIGSQTYEPIRESMENWLNELGADPGVAQVAAASGATVASGEIGTLAGAATLRATSAVATGLNAPRVAAVLGSASRVGMGASVFAGGAAMAGAAAALVGVVTADQVARTRTWEYLGRGQQALPDIVTQPGTASGGLDITAHMNSGTGFRVKVGDRSVDPWTGKTYAKEDGYDNVHVARNPTGQVMAVFFNKDGRRYRYGEDIEEEHVVYEGIDLMQMGVLSSTAQVGPGNEGGGGCVIA